MDFMGSWIVDHDIPTISRGILAPAPGDFKTLDLTPSTRDTSGRWKGFNYI